MDVIKVLEKAKEELSEKFGGKYLFKLNGSEPSVDRISSQGGEFYVYKLGQETEFYSNWVGTFCLAQLPGCCGVCVSYHSRMAGAYKRKGIGTYLNSLRVRLARALGYGVILCTDTMDNTAQRKILQRNGWQDIYIFENPRTENKVAISVQEL
jgi:hypothetical protein